MGVGACVYERERKAERERERGVSLFLTLLALRDTIMQEEQETDTG